MRQNVVGSSIYRGMYGGGSVNGAGMWLEVGETEDCRRRQCVSSQDVAGGRRDGGLYGGGNVSGARMWV